MADHAAAAGAVDHGDRLAQVLFHQAGDDAGGGIGAAAGTPGHDQRDRSRGIALGRCRQGGGGQGGEGAGDEQAAGCTGHAMSPCVAFGMWATAGQSTLLPATGVLGRTQAA